MTNFVRFGSVALISAAESLDTGSAAGRLIITIMGAVSERKAIGERTRDALHHKRSVPGVPGDGQHLEPGPAEQGALAETHRLRGQVPAGSAAWAVMLFSESIVNV
jgi:DNA invertase Pin-like site-specific DNA recombinase